MADYHIPDDLLYSEEDEWARTEDDGRVTIGISDYAQQQLGDIVFVELPEVEARFDRGDAFGVVESVKAVSDLYAPVSGKVVEVNPLLVDSPETVNEQCYGDGWLIVVEPSDPGELSDLLRPKAYLKHVDERSD